MGSRRDKLRRTTDSITAAVLNEVAFLPLRILMTFTDVFNKFFLLSGLRINGPRRSRAAAQTERRMGPGAPQTEMERPESGRDPQSSVILIPLAESRESIILHLSFICAATVRELGSLLSALRPVSAFIDALRPVLPDGTGGSEGPRGLIVPGIGVGRFLFLFFLEQLLFIELQKRQYTNMNITSKKRR